MPSQGAERGASSKSAQDETSREQERERGGDREKERVPRSECRLEESASPQRASGASSESAQDETTSMEATQACVLRHGGTVEAALQAAYHTHARARAHTHTRFRAGLRAAPSRLPPA